MLGLLQQPEFQLLRNRECGHDQCGLLLRRYVEFGLYVFPATNSPRLDQRPGALTNGLGVSNLQIRFSVRESFFKWQC